MLLISPVPSASPDCPPQEQELAALKSLLQNNPETLAKAEALQERPRVMAVMGYTTTFPGMDDSSRSLQCIFKRVDTRVVPGTSDVLCSDEIVRLQPIASQFAARYNAALLHAMDMKCP
jgi:hypothetical protein